MLIAFYCILKPCIFELSRTISFTILIKEDFGIEYSNSSFFLDFSLIWLFDFFLFFDNPCHIWCWWWLFTCIACVNRVIACASILFHHFSFSLFFSRFAYKFFFLSVRIRFQKLISDFVFWYLLFLSISLRKRIFFNCSRRFLLDLSFFCFI